MASNKPPMCNWANLVKSQHPSSVLYILLYLHIVYKVTLVCEQNPGLRVTTFFEPYSAKTEQ